MPDFSLEKQYGDPVCGIDEVGRGPLAGPVVTACVYIPPEKRELSFIAALQDSKKLSRPKLEYCEAYIKEHCIWGIGLCNTEEIDRLNILHASLYAMEKAFHASGLAMRNGVSALIDGNKIPKNLPCPAHAIIKGDSRSKTIAAASILAKLARDRIMHDLHKRHPHYGWDSNVGYPTPAHKEALKRHGVTPHHRKSFAPVREAIQAHSA